MIWISQTAQPAPKNTRQMINPPFARLDCDYNVVVVDCRACLHINMGVWIVALLKYIHSLPKPMFFSEQYPSKNKLNPCLQELLEKASLVYSAKICILRKQSAATLCA